MRLSVTQMWPRSRRVVSGSRVAADVYFPVSLTYAAGLAAAADGGMFAAPLDASRNAVYQRTGAVAKLVGCQPVVTGLELLRPSVAAVSMPGEPLVDATAADGLWSLFGLPNRAQPNAQQNRNLLWNCQGTSHFLNNAATRTIGLLDSAGGLSAMRMQISSGAAGNAGLLRGVLIPPGQWTFSARVKAAGTTGNVVLSFDGGTTRTTLTPSGDWQLVTQTFHQTVATTRQLSIYHGDTPSACVAPVDVYLECVSLMPGTAADAPIVPVVEPQVGFALRGAPAYSGQSLELDGYTLLEAVGLPATMGAWTLQIVGDFTRPASGTLALLAPGSGGTVGPFVTANNAQTVHGLYWDGFNAGASKAKVLRSGQVVLGLAFDGATLRTYINGVAVESAATTSATLTTGRRVGLLGQLSAASAVSNAATGSGVTGATLWGRALSAAEISAAAAAATTRAALHSAPPRAINRIIICEGDSITAGSGDQAPAGGYAMRAVELLTAPVPPVENRAVINATLEGNGGNSLLSRQAALLTRLGELLAAGVTPGVYVMIGANNAGTLTTQAGVDSYVSTLRSYVAALRAAGARVIAGTPLPAQGVSIPAGYEGVGFTASGGPLSGQSFVGGRKYYIALLRHYAGEFDALADFDQAANWQTVASAQAAGYFSGSDYVHPNQPGHASLALLLQPVLAAAIAQP